MKKRILSVLLSLCMVMALLPTTALAASHKVKEYSIAGKKVNVESFTDSYYAYGTNNSCTKTNAASLPDDGWTWAIQVNHSTNHHTITLNGYNGGMISVSSIILGSGNHVQTTVKLIGDNTINQDSGYGLRLDFYTDTTIQGEGTLTVTSTNGFSAISTSNLTISSGTVNATCTAASDDTVSGIYADTVTINGGTVTATCTAASDDTVSGIYAGTVTINDGTVNAGATNNGRGRACSIQGKLDISGGTFTASSNAVGGAPGVNPTLGPGVTAQASTSSDGSNPVRYNAADKDTYRWFQTTYSPVVNAQVPIITEPLVSATYTKGDAAAPLTVVAASPDGGALTYQWYQGDGVTASLIGGATSNTYTPPTDTAGVVHYTCQVTNTIVDNRDGGNKTAVASTNASITVNEPATYSISLDTTDPYIFTEAAFGYGDQTPRTVTVRNTGNQATGALTATLTGGNTDAFVVSGSSIPSIAAGGTNTFTVKPKTGLAAGTYTATVTVSGSNSISANFTVSFTVNKATPSYSVPTGLTAKYGQTLADVSLSGHTGWSWADSTQSVGTPSDTPNTFKAKFTPTDTVNYQTVENIDVSVTVNKADAPALSNIAVNQKYTVPSGEKDIGAAGMPADAGTLTYTKGTESTTGSVTVSSWAVDSAGKVTYTLSGGAAGDSVTLPVVIGSDNYADTTVNVVITLTTKDSQAALTVTGGTTVTYGQTLTLSSTGGSGTGAVTYEIVAGGTGAATIAGNVLTPTTAGTVNVKAVKAADNDYSQAESVPVAITINKATPTGAPAYTPITASGKTLGDAALTVGAITPAGTIVWNLGDSTSVSANTAYSWTFTPSDTANYNTLTGSITPYVVSYSGGDYTPPTYKVESEVTEDTDGSVSFSKGNAKKGDTVTITVTPDRYYKVEGVTVKDKNGKEIAVTDNGDGTFTFKMPDSKVAVEPVFSWDNPFGDVAEDAYYAPAVEWALKNEVTSGTGDGTTFSPDAGCTRAQIMTFLWQAAGCPEPADMSRFTDVSADAYYAKAVAWAVEQGITSGTGDGKFSPDATCTRSQSMTFLYHVAGSPEIADGISFSDVAADSYYADAVVWAARNGVTSGTGNGMFSPDANCTRAQIMTFLYCWLVK